MRWILALVMLLSAGVSELAAQAKGKGIRLWNLTSATIAEFQLSPPGKNDWGPNLTLNDKDKEVDHDERLRITGVEPGRYDAKVGYRGARHCFVRDIEIGAPVATADGDTLVLSNRRVDAALQVFNLTVANDESYFVGDERIWAHNATCTVHDC